VTYHWNRKDLAEWREHLYGGAKLVRFWYNTWFIKCIAYVKSSVEIYPVGHHKKGLNVRIKTFLPHPGMHHTTKEQLASQECVGEKTNGVRVPVSILRKRSSDPKSQPPVCPVIKKSISIAGEDSSLGSSRAPLKLIDGPGIYRALRLRGRILEVLSMGGSFCVNSHFLIIISDY
jgi:hypothetical protein